MVQNERKFCTNPKVDPDHFCTRHWIFLQICNDMQQCDRYSDVHYSNMSFSSVLINLIIKVTMTLIRLTSPVLPTTDGVPAPIWRWGWWRSPIWRWGWWGGSGSRRTSAALRPGKLPSPEPPSSPLSGQLASYSYVCSAWSLFARSSLCWFIVPLSMHAG